MDHVWTIPAGKSKTAREHRVPLSDAARAVLDRARELADGSGLIFPSPMRPGHALSDGTLNHLVKRQAGLPGTVHGFRSTFRDWCADTGKPREVAEAALAHRVGGTEGAYFRSDMFERRARLMGQWAAYVTGERGTVTAIRTG